MESFNDEVDQDYRVSIQFGNLKPLAKDVELLAKKAGQQWGSLKEPAVFKFDNLDCILNQDLVELFKILYRGHLEIRVGTFGICKVKIHASLRQRRHQTLVAYEG